uniref:Probable thymidylate kinase n=1 Tax=uncultured marine group II/III euryarchaeote AD1000_66_E09 TaxID=1457798 RepID=A0A075FVW7_9EURY|nr:Thymidylate kinase (tmk) [uncultured marine group II/III euryarchaeote AD1000_66_E09]
MNLFISIEGGEGSGKSTLSLAIYKHLSKQGIDVISTFEPGGTSLGQTLRSQLFASHKSELESISAWSETFLFLADRTHHTETIIRPALNQGKVVLCDRFTDSTIAYQGYGRGLDRNLIQCLNDLATQGLTPNLTIFLDLDAVKGLARTKMQTEDRISEETLSFHERVVSGYRQLAKEHPQRIHRVDATQPQKEVLTLALTLVESHLANAKDETANTTQ